MAMIETTSFRPAMFSRAAEFCSEAAKQFDAWRVRRGQRLALAQLLEWDSGRLDDLGVTIQDIEDARVVGAPLRSRKW